MDQNKVLSHLKPDPTVTAPKPFAYDTIEALVSVKESRSVESENEKMALAKCLAEVLPIHLDLFPTGDLTDLIPFLPPSDYVPSAVFLGEDSVTQEDLSAVALLQIATCKGRPVQSPDIVKACVRATCWLFERPRTLDLIPKKQPLHLIYEPGTFHFSQHYNFSLYLDEHSPALEAPIYRPGTSHLLSQHCNFSSYPDKLAHDALEALIDILSRFFSFAADFRLESQTIGQTTHTSHYTYWFLVLSAKILTKCFLSEEMLARHSYLLHMIAVRLEKNRLGERKEGDYLFHMTSIYASNITTCSAMHSSPFWPDFLRAVTCYRDDYLKDARKSPLCRAVNADEVVWVNIDRTLEALVPSDTAVVSDSHEANDTMAAHRSLAHAHCQDRTFTEEMEPGGRIGDIGQFPY